MTWRDAVLGALKVMVSSLAAAILALSLGVLIGSLVHLFLIGWSWTQ